MTTANQSGTFKIGGDMEVNRLGFGAMRITGPGIWGEPTYRAEAVRTLQALAPAGINFVDTADSYGPNVSELLIKEVLHPYKGMIVATKAGLTRSGPNQWSPKGNPEYLRAQALGSLERLGVEKIDLWQLHRIDGSVPRESQFEAVRSLVDDKLVRHVGLSEVSIADIEAASKHFKVATVQNQYNLVDRSHEDVLAFCEKNGIGFIPWFPLAAGDLTKPGSVLDKVAADHDATPSQIALAWILRKSPVMLPIPGTSKAKHLNENVAATAIELTDAEFASLDRAGR